MNMKILNEFKITKVTSQQSKRNREYCIFRFVRDTNGRLTLELLEIVKARNVKSVKNRKGQFLVIPKSAIKLYEVIE